MRGTFNMSGESVTDRAVRLQGRVERVDRGSGQAEDVGDTFALENRHRDVHCSFARHLNALSTKTGQTAVRRVWAGQSGRGRRRMSRCSRVSGPAASSALKHRQASQGGRARQRGPHSYEPDDLADVFAGSFYGGAREDSARYRCGELGGHRLLHLHVQ
jgi:hypothetical protein